MTNTGQNSRVQTVLSTLTIMVGVLLLAFMITVEDEPGAIPLLLIVGGIGWLVVTRTGVRRRRS